MRIILVDDEYLQLMRLRTLLEKMNTHGIEIVGEYTDSLEVINQIGKLQPDVVFLDIIMPDIDGLALGEKISEIFPNVEIVFITGFDQYAIDAFNLHAIDYLLKPVQKTRLLKTINRLQQIIGKNPKSIVQTKTIQLLGGLRMTSTDGKIQWMKWRTAKAKELFVYMLNHRDKMICRDILLELLWPESDIDKASKQLYTTIYTIRQTLKNYGVDGIKISSPLFDSGYKLSLENVIIDVEEWVSKLKSLPPLQLDNIDKHERTFYSYTGDYLSGSDYIWAESERERLRRLWLHHAQQLSKFYIRHENYNAAVNIQERVQSFCPAEEESYFTLMELYGVLNNAIAVEGQYRMLKKMLKEQFGMEPSIEIDKWYEEWKNKKNFYEYMC
ncbi:response regulator [Lysinibacillus sp. LZ02]|uniref:response regulator n=1 Tax=Lysinibacillus sp. LZ02 TaxID=3420668 RepID=UPI003D366650